jgi:hypothetical protein
MSRVRLRDTSVERRDHRSPNCYWCDVVLDSDELLSTRTLDHYVPRAAGGSDHYGNLVPSCGFCNWTRDTTPVHLFEPIAIEIIKPYRHDMALVVEMINERDHAMAKRAYGCLLTRADIIPRTYALADVPQEFGDHLPLLDPRRSLLDKCAAVADHARPLVHQNKGYGVCLGQDVVVHSQMVRGLHVPGGFTILSTTELKALKKRCDSTPENERFLMEQAAHLHWNTLTMREHAIGVLHYETDSTTLTRIQKAWVFGESEESARTIIKAIENHRLLPLTLYRPEQYTALRDWDLKEEHA